MKSSTRVLNAEVTCLFSVWLASFRWHELYVGLFTELGNLYINAKGNTQSKQSRGRIPMLYTEADRFVVVMIPIAIGTVMEMERRDRLVIFAFCQLEKG